MQVIELEAEALFLYPVKSCAGVRRARLEIDPEIGLIGDRRMAFAIDEAPAEGDGVFRRKHAFLAGMRWPAMARLAPEADPGADIAERVDRFRLRSADGARAVQLEEAADAAGALASGAPQARLVTARPGGRFSDRDVPYLSIINLDTLDVFAAEIGDPAVARPERWRCNVYVRAGFGAEYGWARDQSVLGIGDARLRVDAPLGRCSMILAEPDLGRRDQPDLLAALRAFERAHDLTHPEEAAPVMGVLALPLTRGAIETAPQSDAEGASRL